MLFETIVRSVASECSTSASISASGAPTRPKPPTITVSPDVTWATASSAVVSASAVIVSWVPVSSRSEGERVRAALHGDPARLRELVDDRRAAEPSEPAVLHPAERHLRLVADGLVVDVDDPGVDGLRQR